MTELTVTTFTPADQDAVRSLVLDGLREHWGELDPGLNRDLDDLTASYPVGVVLVARRADRIVGAGVLVPLGDGTGELKRMAVARDVRRRGVGRALVEAFAAAARERGITRLVLETSADWHEAVAFYAGCGFTMTHEDMGAFGLDIWFVRELGTGDGDVE